MMRGLVTGAKIDMAKFNRAQFMCTCGVLSGPVVFQMLATDGQRYKRHAMPARVRLSWMCCTLETRADLVGQRYIMMAFTAWEGSTISVIGVGQRARYSLDEGFVESVYPRVWTADELVSTPKKLLRWMRQMEPEALALLNAAVIENDPDLCLIAADWLEDHGYPESAVLVRSNPHRALEQAKKLVQYWSRKASA